VTPCQPKCGSGSTLLAEIGVFKGVGPGGVVTLPTSIELVELVRSEGSRVEETLEEVFQNLSSWEGGQDWLVVERGRCR